MEFSYPVVNRRDVVVIFVDMDPSIFHTDLALPYPLGEPGHHSESNTESGCDDDNLDAVLKAPKMGTRDGTFTPPKTRHDIIWQALNSFVVQKLIASTSDMVLPWFSIYAVYDDVEELLGLTCCNFKDMESVMKKQMRDIRMRRRKSTTLGPFPFNDVSNILQKTVEFFPARERRQSGGNVSRRTGNLTMLESVNSTSVAEEQSKNPRTPTVVQGILLLDRESVPRSLRTPPTTRDTGPYAAGSMVQCHLDIIPLGDSSQQHLRSGRTIANTLCPFTSQTFTSAVTETLKINCSCSVVDLLEFTGLTHQGLALGCALTKLLIPHTLRDADFFSRPIPKVKLTSPVKVSPPAARQVKTLRQQPQPLSSPSTPQGQLRSNLPRIESDHQNKGFMVSRETTRGIISRQPVQQDTRAEMPRFPDNEPTLTRSSTSTTGAKTPTMRTIQDRTGKRPALPSRPSHDGTRSGNTSLASTTTPIYSGNVNNIPRGDNTVTGADVSLLSGVVVGHSHMAPPSRSPQTHACDATVRPQGKSLQRQGGNTPGR